MAFGTFTVLAGDFSTSSNVCSLRGRKLYMKRKASLANFLKLRSYEKVPASVLLSVEAVGEASTRSFASSAARGLIGGLALGPVGAFAGVVTGKSKKTVTFKLLFNDGRACLCKSKAEVFKLLQVAAFKAGGA